MQHVRFMTAFCLVGAIQMVVLPPAMAKATMPPIPLGTHVLTSVSDMESRDALRKELKRQEKLEADLGLSLESPHMRQLRLQLARMGDFQERNRIFDALKSPVGAERSKAFKDTAALGDLEAVIRLAEMLDDPTPGGRMTYRERDGSISVSRDESCLPPRMMAAMELAKLVPNPPVAPVGRDKGYYTEEDVAAWRAWWSENRAEVLKKDGNLAERIANPAWPVRQEALKAIANLGKTAGIAERDQLAMSIAELIASGTLGGGHRGGMHMALEALGELRSEKAIPCLVERLAFLPDPFLVEELLPTEMHYPAAGALVKIGAGAIAPMKSLLSDGDAGDVEKRLGLWVLCETLGRERTEEWMKTRPSPLKLSTGESLVDLLPSVGQVFLPPGNRTDWPEPSVSRE